MSEPPIHVDVDHVSAHPRHTGRSRFDLIVALLAIFISGVSLAVAVEHGKTERDLVASSSWPFLREILANQYNAAGDIVVGVSNGGVGPAKLKSLEMFYDGRPVASALDLLRRCCGLGATPADIRRQLPNGLERSLIDENVLRPGEDVPVILVHRLRSAPDVPDRLAASMLRITFRACYCSVLDECWISDLRTTRTKKVKACAAPKHPFNPLAD